ncbi:MAG: hypothetical protein JXA66_03290 [Oligoflexia bacterium]|nr:hypothetical protein [Oligoflexia bacterium]
MFDLKLFMPEFSIVLTIIILCFFLIEGNKSRNNSRNILDTVFVTGLSISAFWLLLQFFSEPVANYKLLIYRDRFSTIYKLYFIFAALYFMFNYSIRYHIMERLSVLSFVLAVSFLFTSMSRLLTFVSFSLLIVSSYGFILTRFRPKKDLVLLASSMLMLVLVYQSSTAIPLLLMLIVPVILIHFSADKSIEGFLVYFIIPAVTYLIIRYSDAADVNPLFFRSLRIIGLSLLTASAILLFSSVRDWKRNAKYGLFYIAHIIFMLGINTIETKILAIIMIFLLPVIYTHEFNFFTVLNLSMLPPSPMFLIKVSLLTIIFSTGNMAEKIILPLSGFFFAVYAALDVSSTDIRKKISIIPGRIFFKYLSVIVVFFCLVYFEMVKNMLKTTILALAGNIQS